MSRIVISFISAIFLTSAFFVFHTSEANNTPLEPPQNINPQAFAVIELFTSLSCSSCPKAEKHVGNIIEMAKNKSLPVYPIAFHVDYWNHLDWIDEFSNEAYSERQQQYARVFNKKNIYTPQMVINGQFEFVGSDLSLCEEKIFEYLNKTPRQIIKIEASYRHVGDSVKVVYKLNKNNPGILNIALIEKYSEIKIESGENSGKKIECYNVVRRFRQISARDSSGSITFIVPKDLEATNITVILYVQNKIDMRIAGAVQAINI
jgi:hypothetical protein